MSVLPLMNPNLWTGPSASSESFDSTAIINDIRVAVTATYRLFCQRHRQGITPQQADEFSRQTFDEVLHKERLNPAFASQVAMDAALDKINEKLGLTADAELMADHNARVAQIIRGLPHHLTMI